MIADIFTFG